MKYLHLDKIALSFIQKGRKKVEKGRKLTTNK